jgi:hypothetical protein
LPKAVRELMDKRGSIYSDRPHMPMAFDAVSNQRRQFFMPYGDRWRAGALFAGSATRR